MKDERLGLWHTEMHNNVQILVHHSGCLLLCQKSDEPEMAEKNCNFVTNFTTLLPVANTQLLVQDHG